MKDEEIARLIGVAKQISDPPTKAWRIDEAQRRKDFRMTSKDGEFRFRAFARQSVRFQENFSIGLEYEPDDGSDAITLLRCNGPHGVFNRGVGIDHPHFHPHVHRATSSAIDHGERPEMLATITSEYAALKEALRYFLNLISLDSNDQARWFADDLRTTQYDLEFES